MPITVVSGRLVLPTGVLPAGAVVVDGERIAWVGPAADLPDAFRVAPVLAAPPGGHVLPGLVDLHCHGGGGASFPDAVDAEEALVAVREHRRHGTTTMLASLVTAAPADLLRQVALLSGLAEDGDIAGIHLEGPFLSVARCGAQDPALILPPDAVLTRALLEAGGGHVCTMTLAPEERGALGADGVAAALVRGGALPSWGHTDADPAAAARALAESLRLLGDPADAGRRPTVTHLFNAMRPWMHRDPGPAGELLVAAREGRAVVELVGDGTHVDPAVVREVARLVGRDGVALVTDATAAAGMPDGAYRLGSRDVVVTGGVARLAGGGAIAGGTAHLLDVVRVTVAAGVPLADAVHMASAVPAAVLGLGDRGALAAGARADVVLTDADLRPVVVLRGGAPQR
ncbi:N-acetylglucosamine-6-phosphate deacetylase [Actinotalea sp. Marseille-Q4924]|uniref:N-acetylglucosamine-6-phosphate deacetylase n=1 Tax=Actinotalea sp. Marseille-Q4924 TaxID=2866571 RepID=UPI001CE3FEE0|nr:amidohydrolase family protein [Actinotalea sp. Marseille-Q4924]